MFNFWYQSCDLLSSVDTLHHAKKLESCCCKNFVFLKTHVNLVYDYLYLGFLLVLIIYGEISFAGIQLAMASFDLLFYVRSEDSELVYAKYWLSYSHYIALIFRLH